MLDHISLGVRDHAPTRAAVIAFHAAALAASVIATGRLHRSTVLDALRAALAGQGVMQLA